MKLSRLPLDALSVGGVYPSKVGGVEVLADEEGESDCDEFEGNWSEDRGSRQRNCFPSKEARTTVQVGQEEEEEKVEAEADLRTRCEGAGDKKVEDGVWVESQWLVVDRDVGSAGKAAAMGSVEWGMRAPQEIG